MYTHKLGTIQNLLQALHIRYMACHLTAIHNTGHYLDESVVAAAITPDNRHLFTGDTQGIGRTWDLSQAAAAFAATGLASVEGRSQGGGPAVRGVARWRAHSSGVSSAAALDGRCDLVLTSGQDCTVSLWSVGGAQVGTFGQVCCDCGCHMFSVHYMCGNGWPKHSGGGQRGGLAIHCARGLFGFIWGRRWQSGIQSLEWYVVLDPANKDWRTSSGTPLPEQDEEITQLAYLHAHSICTCGCHEPLQPTAESSRSVITGGVRDFDKGHPACWSAPMRMKIAAAKLVVGSA